MTASRVLCLFLLAATAAAAEQRLLSPMLLYMPGRGVGLRKPAAAGATLLTLPADEALVSDPASAGAPAEIAAAAARLSAAALPAELWQPLQLAVGALDRAHNGSRAFGVLLRAQPHESSALLWHPDTLGLMQGLPVAAEAAFEQRLLRALRDEMRERRDSRLWRTVSVDRLTDVFAVAREAALVVGDRLALCPACAAFSRADEVASARPVVDRGGLLRLVAARAMDPPAAATLPRRRAGSGDLAVLLWGDAGGRPLSVAVPAADASPARREALRQLSFALGDGERRLVPATRHALTAYFRVLAAAEDLSAAQARRPLPAAAQERQAHALALRCVSLARKGVVQPPAGHATEPRYRVAIALSAEYAAALDAVAAELQTAEERLALVASSSAPARPVLTEVGVGADGATTDGVEEGRGERDEAVNAARASFEAAMREVLAGSPPAMRRAVRALWQTAEDAEDVEDDDDNDDGEGVVFVLGTQHSGRQVVEQLLARLDGASRGPGAAAVTDLAAALERWERSLDAGSARAFAAGGAAHGALRAAALHLLRGGHTPQRRRSAVVVESTDALAAHVRTLAAALPGARFVHVVRDPRTVAGALVSQHAEAASPPPRMARSPRDAALYWAQRVARVRTAFAAMPAAASLTLRLEDVVGDPAAAAAQLAGFAGLPAPAPEAVPALPRARGLRLAWPDLLTGAEAAGVMEVVGSLGGQWYR